MSDVKIPSHESYAEKHGIPEVTISEAAWNIKLNILQGLKRGVICLISDSGMGKTQINNQVATELGYRLVDVRTAAFSLIGAGVPQAAVDGRFEIAVPDDFPKAGEKCIMHFDEINQGQPHALAMFFKLLEDRGLYNYTLPDETIIVASMNPATAQYAVSRIESNAAINRRLLKFSVVLSFVEWLDHAKTTEFHKADGIEKACHPEVLKFLLAEPSKLYITADRDGGKQYACPATWQTVSRSLYALEAFGEPLTSGRSENRIAASVNPITASELVSSIKSAGAKINPEQVLKEYTTDSLLRARIQLMQTMPGGDYHALVTNVASYLHTEKLPPVEIAPQLALFWSDMPIDLAQSFYQMQQGVVYANTEKMSEGLAYARSLVEVLVENPIYQALTKKLISVSEVVEALSAAGAPSNSPEPQQAE